MGLPLTGEDHGLHIMRHTACTWMMLQGLSMGQIAKYLGMSVRTLERTYGHHHPDYQQEVASFRHLQAYPRQASFFPSRPYGRR